MTYTEENEGETTAEAERDVEATQQRYKTKEALSARNILTNMQLRLA